MDQWKGGTKTGLFINKADGLRETTTNGLTSADSSSMRSNNTSELDTGNLHTVETEQASIKFFGGVSTGGLSESESEGEEELTKDEPLSNGLSNIDEPDVQNTRDIDDSFNTEVQLLIGKSNNSRETPGNEDQCEKRQAINNNVQINITNEDGIIKNSNKPSSDSSSSPSRETRFNPFDRDVFFEEDHFASNPQTISPSSMAKINSNFISPGSKFVGSSVSSDSYSSHDLFDDEFSFADLGLAEDHFSRPEGHFGMSTLEELEMAMENCKDLIKESLQNSDRQKNLVRKLVHLRIKYQEYKEGPEPVGPDVRLVVGHRFKEKESRSSKHYCEKCNGVIWGMLQVSFRCTECGYHCHDKCLNQITRTCASVKVLENPCYVLSISPEKGLASQNYRCAECKSQIAFKTGYSEPRLCDYSGNFYCELCHWNDTMIIPARVLHNWDFEPRKVCRASKQYLKLMSKKAVLRIQDINPMLFNFVEELDDVRKLREEILVMKKYFLSCKTALESKLLLQLKSRQHCVENSDMYSLSDLVDVNKDILLPELAKVHSSFAQHIKSDCQVCQGKGFICELCDTHEVLFPFDNIAVVCAQCSYVLHRHCFVRRNNSCPRCERRNKRNELSGDNS